ncbi:MAG: alpha/beta fold hydrolase [Clostridia bacterium]
MSLSLQVKKFINSEHTGQYVDITLPNELPSETKGKEDEDTQSMPRYETTRIHYLEEGTGEPLILLHTVGQSLYTWRLVFQRLSEHYRVIALDLLGHGYSDRPISFGYTIRDHAESIRLFMDAMDIESAHFMAFSMGSAYVGQFAVDNPGRVGRILMIAPGGVSAEMPLPVRLIDSTIFGGIASMLYNRGTVRRILEDCFFDLTCVSEDMVQEYYKSASDLEGRRAIRSSLHFFDETALTKRIRELDTPILIVRGGEDKWRTSEQTEELHTILPDAGYSIIRNAGHVVQEEKPDRVIASVLEFIPVVMPGQQM